ncbi:hypothetical protein C3B51_17825 [Pseudoalteromonas rubra]|uniref:Uncharacterized protein n=1 Tax=Pseudoalteromonas rubra TaxID=43658 RepID=A0A4V2E211_9GAMM|nr:hypothetical protein C3B51_17825 [Pseudoalteromonas rubra]
MLTIGVEPIQKTACYAIAVKENMLFTRQALSPVILHLYLFIQGYLAMQQKLFGKNTTKVLYFP